MSRFKDLTGQRFGRLTVVERAPSGKRYATKWYCKCDCGNTVIVLAGHLGNGHTQSCGCIAREGTIERSTKHGLSDSKVYHVWHDMIDRCTNKSNEFYNDYGGRGIAICDEWMDLKIFHSWAINKGYKKGLSLDRINNNEGYNPNNCKWSTMKEQGNNRRTNKLITINGITHTVTEWAELSGIRPETIFSRLRAKFKEEYLLLPPQAIKKQKIKNYKH